MGLITSFEVKDAKEAILFIFPSLRPRHLALMSASQGWLPNPSFSRTPHPHLNLFFLVKKILNKALSYHAMHSISLFCLLSLESEL